MARAAKPSQGLSPFLNMRPNHRESEEFAVDELSADFASEVLP